MEKKRTQVKIARRTFLEIMAGGAALGIGASVIPVSLGLVRKAQAAVPPHYPLVDQHSIPDTYLFHGAPSGPRREFFSFSHFDEIGEPLTVRVWYRARSADNQDERALRAQLRHPGTGSNDTGSGTSIQRGTFLSNDWEYYFTEWHTNPFAGNVPWTWSEINQLEIAASILKHDRNHSFKRFMGAQLAEMWIEVISGCTSSTPYLVQGPVFGGLKTTGEDQASVKVFVRASNNATIGLRYGETEIDVKENVGIVFETTGVSANSETDYTAIIEVTGLKADTEYFFDVLIDGRSTHKLESESGPWNGDHPYWESLPRCKTFPLPSSIEGFKFIMSADAHLDLVGKSDSWLDWEVFQNIGNESDVRFIIDAGDHACANSDNADEIRQALRDLRTFERRGMHYVKNVLKKTPLVHVWSDHDFLGNNTHKFGTAEYAGSYEYRAGQISLTEHQHYTPFYNLEASDDWHCYADNGAGDPSNEDLYLSDPGSIPSDVYPGMVVYNASDESLGIIHEIDRTSNPAMTLFGDGLVKRNTTSTPGAFHNGDQVIIQRSGLWQTFTYGDLAQFFIIDIRYHRDPGGTPGGDQLDGTSFGAPGKDSGTTSRVETYKLIDSSKDFYVTVSKGDKVHNETTDDWAIVVEAPSNGDDELFLNRDIFTSTGQSYRISESGASEGRNSAGHTQRDWLVDAINNAPAEHWKFIVCEMPFLYQQDAAGYDHWADYDGIGDGTGEHPELQAQREYLRTHITADNVIWISGDRHFTAFNDGTDSIFNPWPEFTVAPLFSTPGTMNNFDAAGDAWYVDNGSGPKRAKYDKHDREPFGGYGVIEVTRDKVTIRSYDEHGNIFQTSADGLGAMVMQIDNAYAASSSSSSVTPSSPVGSDPAPSSLLTSGSSSSCGIEGEILIQYRYPGSDGEVNDWNAYEGPMLLRDKIVLKNLDNNVVTKDVTPGTNIRYTVRFTVEGDPGRLYKVTATGVAFSLFRPDGTNREWKDKFGNPKKKRLQGGESRAMGWDRQMPVGATPGKTAKVKFSLKLKEYDETTGSWNLVDTCFWKKKFNIVA